MTQCDKMWELYRKFDGDPERIIAAYAEAERNGEVRRWRNSWNRTPENYAYLLLAHGRSAGWIYARQNYRRARRTWLRQLAFNFLPTCDTQPQQHNRETPGLSRLSLRSFLFRSPEPTEMINEP